MPSAYTFGLAAVFMTFDDVTSLVQSRFGSNSRRVEADHWMFEIGVGRNRSQVVHLIFKDKRWEGEDVSRLVIDTPIGPLPSRYDPESLLRRNAELDVGAICIEDFRNEDRERVTYLTLRASHLIKTLDRQEMWEMIDMVAHVADKLEKDIYARDLY